MPIIFAKWTVSGMKACTDIQLNGVTLKVKADNCFTLLLVRCKAFSLAALIHCVEWYVYAGCHAGRVPSVLTADVMAQQ